MCRGIVAAYTIAMSNSLGNSMTIYKLDGISPQFDDERSCYVAPGALIIGQVAIGTNVSFWPYAVVRGDNEPMRIGSGTNIQEHALLHSDPGFPLTIGEGCTIGHRAVIHGCTIGSHSLIGMGATILNGAIIGNNCLVGAGALVTEGKIFDAACLIVGSPARAIRSLTSEEIRKLEAAAIHYVQNGRRFKTGLEQV